MNNMVETNTRAQQNPNLTPPPIVPPVKRNHLAIIIIPLFVLGVVAGGLWIFKFTYLDRQSGCIQVIAWAQNPQTGEIRAFPTPCDVPKDWKEMSSYYSSLAEQCQNKQDVSCCMSSVNTMKVGGYKSAENNACPEGYAPNTELCIDSFKWCEPIKDEAANWQTYRNEEYGFEFRYPPRFLMGKFKPSDTVTSDLSWNNVIVFIESDLFNATSLPNSKLKFSLDSIPVGDVPTITVKPITTSAKFYREEFIDNVNNVWKGEKVKIGEYTVTKLPGYPGPYGDAMYYYLLPISDNLIVEFTGHKQTVNIDNDSSIESHYDQIIEKIISTFKFTK